MDEIQMLRDLYEPPAPASARDVLAARARLDGMARRSHRRPRRRWVVPGAGLMAVAAAVTVAVNVWQAPSPRNSPPAQTAGARTMLLAAASRADRQPATTGKYWHVDSRTRAFLKARSGGYLVCNTESEESWQAADRSGQTIDWFQNRGAQPATPADRRAWREAGSPRVIRTIHSVMGMAPERAVKRRGPADLIHRLGVVPVEELDRVREIPSDPGKLRTWLLSLRESPTRRKPDGRGRPTALPPEMPRMWGPPHGTRAELERWLFVEGSSLILYAPVTPKVRAAAFRMLATLSDVKPVGTVRDADGREGTAVAMDEIDELGRPMHVQRRLIIDPKSGRALASEDVVLAPNPTFPGLAPGAVGMTTTVRTADWTDKAPG